MHPDGAELYIAYHWWVDGKIVLLGAQEQEEGQPAQSLAKVKDLACAVT
jgi:hypothetical protein